ncbi:uncharacterized protein LOC135842809 [Planococcus citri]|uniref:uncharacterized protein LOC135842809 n=1 Tax=Planococcus citri TaxID=170843 RepID=UPI0031F83748
MSDGRETSGMEDKAVSTADDFGDGNDGYFGEGTHWNAVTIQKLLTVLINNKIMAMRTMSTCEHNIPSDKSDSTEYSREKEPPDKRSRLQHSPRHQHRHHHRHCPRHSSHHDERSSSISKVQKWSEDLDMESPEDDPPRGRKSKQPKEGYLVVDIESGSKVEQSSKRRKRKKRKKSVKKKKISQIDPEDLPTRARWTIIITSGLLILTCMFLVGVTLRMAPVIDQMVRTQNEELMNSLNRNNYNEPAHFYSSYYHNTPPN